jgi:hypothetical protein
VLRNYYLRLYPPARTTLYLPLHRTVWEEVRKFISVRYARPQSLLIKESLTHTFLTATPPTHPAQPQKKKTSGDGDTSTTTLPTPTTTTPTTKPAHATAASSSSSTTAVASAAKKAKLKGKTRRAPAARRSSSSASASASAGGGRVLGGADYVDILMGSRRREREEAQKLPRDES